MDAFLCFQLQKIKGSTLNVIAKGNVKVVLTGVNSSFTVDAGGAMVK